MQIKKLIELVNKCFEIHGLREHSKASEKYIDLTITFSDKTTWSGSIPFCYRRTGLFLERAADVAEYLEKVKKYFTKENQNIFKEKERKYWVENCAGKSITKPFFDILLNLSWNSVKYDFPPNPNWARRIQDIKEMGYTLVTNTNKVVKGKSEKDTHIMLLPIPRDGGTGYETMSSSFKKRAISALNSVNIYELSSANKYGLIPDHKFPEIRWDDKTKEDNDNLSVEKIREKFQLLDNQRNLQKRENCRKCFQTNIRGKIFGINFFYEGNQNWPKTIPKIGKEAEKGCVGCGWYDIEKWRSALNELIENNKGK
jgi:hypothetical protein